ncbi:membrane protein [Pectobacterium brasiliense]|uniref:AEC family transporter n=1 Tax=Pectobacterium TaxID=122277 RepID=UPI0004E67277|nr:AEC family transporter [Pectobacterium brasiliense]KFF69976.1 membrane protein [Pectobacterium brasiliense]KHS95251.1 membrane protein [Pectobacterium brasiliense]MBN3041522.1 AEC family transporter [Pectobacterium brasiliense]MBN3125177.1 AEC family transporter [Pectobacterium brasiliense]MBN3143637.1 AEC family transporter [Pectobacterium brasiliense]
MPAFIVSLWHQIFLSLPLFVLIALGYSLIRYGKWPTTVTDGMTRFVFSVAMPAMLFRLMSDFSKRPVVDARLLIAFFGGCLLVFVLGRIVARKVFYLDGVSGSLFALSGIFSNNVMLGLPIATLMLGEEAIPSVALVVVFNGLILWTLVTVSVEWARNGALSLQGFTKTALGVLKNPLIIGILSGTLFSLTGLPLPSYVDQPLAMLGQIAAPLSLVALGMGLAEYRVRDGWQISTAICTIKLLVQPLVIWGIAIALGLPEMETRAVVLLGSMAVGVNVYLMSRQFDVLGGPVASSLLLSTAMAALTTPLILTLMGVRL